MLTTRVNTQTHTTNTLLRHNTHKPKHNIKRIQHIKHQQTRIDEHKLFQNRITTHNTQSQQ